MKTEENKSLYRKVSSVFLILILFGQFLYPILFVYARWPTQGWDFTIQKVSISSEWTYDYEYFWITVEIKNTGTQLGTVYIELGIQYPDGHREYPSATKIYDIDVGQVKSFTFGWPSDGKPTGTYYADVDVYNPDQSHMFDTSGFNYPFTVKGKLSLSIISPPSPTNGETVSSLPITLKVRATAGSTPVQGATLWFVLNGSNYGPYYTDSNGYATHQIGSLAAGTSVSWYAYIAAVKTPTWSFTYNPPMPSLSVQVSANPSSITTSQSSTITVTVTSGGSAVSGASVSLSCSPSGPSLNPPSGTTGSDGRFTATFSSSTTGTFTITATASKSGYNSGSGNTQVTVSSTPNLSTSASPFHHLLVQLQPDSLQHTRLLFHWLAVLRKQYR